MQSLQRVVIVNEDDNRKLNNYTEGDVDATPSGVGVFACDPTTTMRILRTDNDGNLSVNVQTGIINPLNTPTTTALTLTTANTAYLLPASELATRKTLIIYNGSDADVYIGSASVTTANGILLPSSGSMQLDVSAGLYAVCGSAGKILNILELR